MWHHKDEEKCRKYEEKKRVSDKTSNTNQRELGVSICPPYTIRYGSQYMVHEAIHKRI